MKTQRLNSTRQQGNTLLMTICITGLIGFLLASYLTLVSSQNGANARSQSWNSAMPIVEAGIEDALAHLNTPRGLTNGPLDVDNWTLSAGIYTVTRSLGDSRYSVSIHNYRVGDPTSYPYIESRGFVTMPLVLTANSGPLLAAAGGGTTAAYLARGVRARTIRDFIFTKGMVAKDSIDLNGNNIKTDSFDSMDPNHSTNGMYSPGMAKDNGDIAVNSALTNSMNVGNANIYGHVSVGPGGVIDIGNNGSVGSETWHEAGNKGIESGWSKDDMNVSFDEVVIPFSGGLPLPGGGWITNTTYTVSSNTSVGAAVYVYPATCGGTVSTNTVTAVNYPIGHPGPVTTNKNGGGQITGYTYNTYACTAVATTTNAVSTATYYDYVFDGSGDYSGHTISGTVYIKDSVRVYVTDTLDISAMVIKSGASLKLYSSAPSVQLAGNNTANSDGTADSFSFWGTSAVKSITFSGNANFTGTIYAPEAAFELNGSGTSAIDFSGASITKTVKMNGHFNFHYDEALRRIGPFRAYIVTGWNEMSPTEISSAVAQ